MINLGDFRGFKMSSSKAVEKIKEYSKLLFIGLALFLAFPASAGAVVQSVFLYKLSDFTGVIPCDWTRVAVDWERNETYVLYQNIIRVFNESGMEIYRFGDDLALGQINDVAVDGEGNILLLSYANINGTPKGAVSLCNYRGELRSKIEWKNFPPDFSNYSPSSMVYRDGLLYFMSGTGMSVVVTDANGNFRKGYDLFPLLGIEEKKRGSVEITGFSVDDRGNILFTVAVLFKAYVLSPDGKLASFGRPGGAPGLFNVVAGIAADSKGNYLVADKLKSAVMVFDSNFNFLTQFGYRSARPGSLIVPYDIAIDRKDRIYISQAHKQGVSVFKLAD